jgi:hypothetical protein
LFGGKVDLVDVRAHRNPYFMAEALRHREMLYAPTTRLSDSRSDATRR